MKKNLILFLVVPTALNLLLLGLYYSGNQAAQFLVAPQIEWLHHRSWREFGLLEQLQNLYLLAIVLMFLVAFVGRDLVLERLFFLIGTCGMFFLLLEEIDYGIHFYEYYVGHEIDMDAKLRNWHNQDIAGESITGYLKRITNFVMFFWFLLFPLLAKKLDFGALKRIIPSPWFIAGFALSLLLSSLAHYLDEHQYDVINGVAGSLSGNVSEFRESSTYYLYLLYAIQLVNTTDLFSRYDGEFQRNT